MNRGSPDFEYRATRDLMLAGASTTANAGLSRGFALLAPLAAAVCFSGRAHAGPIAPNPGGATVLTNSTTATTGYVDTPVTQRVDNYSTTLLAFLNGNQFFSETFPALTDPTVQAAISQADAILSGDGASFGGPLLLSNASVLQSSVTAPPPAYTCETVESAPGEYVTGSAVTDTVTFGRATIMAGDCQSDTFTVLTGQLDINLNSDDEFAVPRTIVTTGTYLTSQTYEISGTTADASVPEPASAGLLLAGLGAVVWCRRSRGSNPGCVVHSFGTNLRTVIQVGTNVCVFVADPDSDDIAAFNSTDFAAPARTGNYEDPSGSGAYTGIALAAHATNLFAEQSGRRTPRRRYRPSVNCQPRGSLSK